MKKIGVVLSGCGVNDGSEIHETVFTLWAIEKAGAQAVCMAPNVYQDTVVNHLTQEPQAERRNALVESARIARGKIQELGKVKADDLDGLVFPGGFGAALNLCTFGSQGEHCVVEKEVSRLVVEMWKGKKPIGALCIAPALIAAVFRDQGETVRLTIGTDAGTARKLQAMGAVHEPRKATEVAVDETNRIVTTPAYMLCGSLSELAEGIEKAVRKVVELAGAGAVSPRGAARPGKQVSIV
jgi:enhancing lycopene biosynthesis protein 2